MKKINLILITLIILIAGILRLSNLSQNPPSPYWDEVSLGYDAYSILKTGKDFHGDSFPIVAFESFGDFKPSLYFYATVPSIFFFGLNTFAIRFPSAFFGILTVFLTYYLTKKLTKSDSISLLASFLLSVSPWHLQLSRVGFEANLGLFLVVLATWLFIKSLSKPKWLFFSVTSFALSMYTYHANRVFVPLLGLSLGIFYFKKIIKHKKMVILSTILFLSLITPLTIKLSDPEVTKRFQETSAFSSLDQIV